MCSEISICPGGEGEEKERAGESEIKKNKNKLEHLPLILAAHLLVF